MKTIILAGGWGSRLGQLTESIPKPMVQIGNKPVLWHIMNMYAHFGFNDFIIALGVKQQVIREYFFNFAAYNCDLTIDLASGSVDYHGSVSQPSWKVTLVDTGINTLKGGRIKRLESYLDDDVNMVTYGDGVADVDIRALVDYHTSHDGLVTITGVRPSARFGELTDQNGRVLSFVEKPKRSETYINGGFMVFDKGLLDVLTPDENCDLEFGPLENLAKDGKVMVYKHEGNWECMDHERDVTHLNTLWADGNAFWTFDR